MKENKIIWEKRYGEDFTLTFWKYPIKCEKKGCNNKTHFTSSGPLGLEHAVCPEHLKELMAYHVAVVPQLLKKLQREAKS